VDTDLFDLPSDFGGKVRLFPLPKLVMFPRNVQPLHIFESRYREMIEDAIQDDQLIAMATLMPGDETDYYSRPPIAPHICIGRVASHEKTQDGKYNLILVGISRAQIGDEVTPVKSFRRANVHVLDERPLDLGNPIYESIGCDLAKCLIASLPSAKELVDEFLKRNISLSTLTDVIAFHFPFDVEFKLELLADLDAVKRAKLLLQRLPRQSIPKVPGSETPGFSDN
jgi:ATP-dependent Lon protease